MKTRLIFLVLLIVCISCGTNNKPVSDAKKEKIKGEVKEVVNTIFKSAEEANFEMTTEPWLDSPDFVYAYNGNSLSYKEFVDAMKPVFSSLINQKMTMVDEKYAVLDNSTVLYTANSKFIVNYKDGHSILQDPWVVQFILKKIDSRWRVIHCAESGSEKSIGSESSKGLDQVELIKQLVGSWKCDIGKDTTAFVEYKSYGTGLEGYQKHINKGKIIMENKQLWGFDKTDEGIGIQMIKGGITEMYAFWWTSNNKYLFIPYNYISNPEKASFKIEGEIKSPDMFITTTIVNNKLARTNTYTRVK